MSRLLFSPTENHWFFHLTLSITLLAISLIAINSYSHLEGIQSACTHWPLCKDSFIEMLQRILIFSLAALIGVLTIASLFAARHFTAGPFLITLLLIPCVIAEIFVNKFLASHISITLEITQSTLQLGMLTLLWWICKIAWPRSYNHAYPTMKMLKPWTWIALLLLWLEVIGNSVLNVNFSPSNCMIFPYCNDQLANLVHFKKTFTFFLSSAIHHDASLPYFNFYHKLIEICMLTYLSIYSFILLFNRAVFQKAFCILLLISLQILLGILNVKSHYHIAILMTHVIVACLLLITVFSLLIGLHNKPRDFWYE